MQECYFRIRNFEDFQHYSKRNPPWIRLYYRLLHDRRFFRLSDENKYLIIGLFLLASQHENRVAADPEWIAKELSLSVTTPDWQAILESEFILPIDCDASVLLSRLTKTCSHSITDNSDNSEVIPEILSFSPKSAKRSLREAIDILRYWNEQPATIHHRELNTQEKAITKSLRRYSPEEIKRAIERYSIVRQNADGKYRDLYAWTLGEFLTRQDGYNLERFNSENWEEPFLLKAFATANVKQIRQPDLIGLPIEECDREAMDAAIESYKKREGVCDL